MIGKIRKHIYDSSFNISNVKHKLTFRNIQDVNKECVEKVKTSQNTYLLIVRTKIYHSYFDIKLKASITIIIIFAQCYYSDNIGNFP